MHPLYVVGVSLVGVLAGGVLDPVGQRLADASRSDEPARRAEAAVYETGSPELDRAGPEGRTDDDRAPAAAGPAVYLLRPGPVPARTAAAALLTGALFGAAAQHFGRDLLVAPFCVFFAMLVSVSMTDLTHRLVPRRLVYPGLALIVPLLVVVAAVDHRWHSFTGSLVAGAVAFGLFFAIWWFAPRGMGFGDVRLAGTIGFVVGYLSVLHAYVAFLAGFLAGLVFGVVVLVVTRSGRRTAIPFAPALAVGAVVGVFWGGPVGHALFHAS